MNNPDDVGPLSLVVGIGSDELHCNLDYLVRLQVEVGLGSCLDGSA